MPLAYQAGARPELTRREQVCFGAGFGFISGYVNVICLVRYNAFGTLMTGNLLHMAKCYCEHGFAWSGRSGTLLPLPVFFFLTICARNLGLLAHHLVEKRRSIPVAPVLAPLHLGATFLAELSHYLFKNPWIPERWDVWLVAFGFGVQSQVSWPALGIPTMMATGHMSNLFNTAMQVALGEVPSSELRKVEVPAAVTIAMLAGAILGASAHHRLRGRKTRRAYPFLLTPITVFQAVLLVLVERRASTAKQDVPNIGILPKISALVRDPRGFVGRWVY